LLICVASPASRARAKWRWPLADAARCALS
jgi:hypothetical protein